MSGVKGIISALENKVLPYRLEMAVTHVKVHVFILQLNDGFSLGAEVEIIFKKIAPLLVKGEDHVFLSAPNRLTVSVAHVTFAESFAEVDLVSGMGSFTVVLTIDVAQSLELKSGDNLFAFIKPSDNFFEKGIRER